MKHQIISVFLASAILVSCTKDEITPYKPGSTPSPLAPKQAPFGTVIAPYLAISLQDVGGTQFKIEKYMADGSVRATLLDGYFAENHRIYDPDFSPAGEKFVYGENQNLYILDVNTLQRQQLASIGETGIIHSTELSPDGSFVAFLTLNSDNTSDLNLISSESEANPVKLTDADLTTVSAGPPAFSPDGSKITYTENLNVVVSDLNGDNKMRITQGDRQAASYPIFNNDGTRLIYFLNQDHGLTLVSSEVGEGAGDDQVMVSFLGRFSIATASHLVLSDDGNTLYFAGTSSGLTHLYSVPVSGGEPVRLAFNITNSGEYMVSGLNFIGWRVE